jgi:phosphoribosylaminoimidazole-succinocarboxamide synthase
MLKRVFDCEKEIQLLMEGKGKAVAELKDGEWICEFVFLVDVTTHFNELNTLLQNKGRLISSMINSFKVLDIKLCLGI